MLSIHLRSQNNLIIKMGVKCPKKTNRWVHWGRVLNFYERYRRPNIARTEEKHPENLPWAKWWVSCTRWRPPSWRSTSRSLSCRANRCWCAAAGVVQCVDRHAHYHVLHRGRLSGRERENDGEAEYVSIGSMRIDVASIESHIATNGRLLASTVIVSRLTTRSQLSRRSRCMPSCWSRAS